jgi:pSer/pThr/pTyr-binding forkhead associated (FHA) protein
MPKLVVLSEGLTGRSYELSTVLTSIGRLEDNSFQIPEPSVSSHHCEIMLRGNDVIIKDLNSTNGTFVNGQRVTDEAPVKPGQIVRLGQIEVRLEGEQQPTAKKLPDKTVAIPQGVNLTAADQGTKTMVFDKNSPFAKKNNRGTKMFVIGAAIIGFVLFAVIIYIVFFGSSNMVTPP